MHSLNVIKFPLNKDHTAPKDDRYTPLQTRLSILLLILPKNCGSYTPYAHFFARQMCRLGGMINTEEKLPPSAVKDWNDHKMKKLYALLCAAVMTLAAPLTAHAVTHYDPAEAHLTYTGAPEGTVYMDILVKMDKDDPYYTEYTYPPQYGPGDTLPISSDSEICQYNTDGYISLSLHHIKAPPMTVVQEGETIFKMNSVADESCDFIDMSIEYGNFRAAYVDGEGNVLGVTNESVTEYSMDTPYGLEADGDSLIFHRHGAHPRVIALTVAGVALLLISLPIIAFFIYFKRTKRINADDLEKTARKNLK